MTPWPFPRTPLDYPVAPPIPGWVRPRQEKKPPPTAPEAPF